ncbi:hypothetical protein SLEP1_g41288 [Rubroshorea leprosula]|uniref:DUF7036 domain-containing protein n=1 Tax=Rubroshorea leprosula TaxID=152421 RepID=A0AAV5L626_9ROSI|nr:hypothetical protein SLEP1_g41288 [Rubroshorea leprosula]
MGKAEEEQNLSGSTSSEGSEQNVEPRLRCVGFRWRRFIGLRCLLVLLFSLGVFLSALFWLPPFLRFADQGDLDLDPRFKGHDIVASFNLHQPISLLEDNILQLGNDILDEIDSPSIKIVILDLEPLAGSNITKVVFAVDPEVNYSKISPTAESLVRASFEYLVTHQSSLRLTKSLFGDPSFFEVLRFPGGITVIPLQNVFLLQKVQFLFNFTLNFPIYQIQVRFNELAHQLKLGLQLAPYENLYVSLSNSKGSTVDPPTIVQSSVLLAIGKTPSMPRLKQLAQTIKRSHSRNLGLNNTVFGRVKQVHLSSILQHSLNGGDGTSWSPSPAPLPHSHQSQHHHHHHRHHVANLPPAVSPAPSPENGARWAHEAAPASHNNSPTPRKSSPAPQKSHRAEAPGCQFRNSTRFKGKTREASHSSPTVAPRISPHHSASLPKHKHQQVPAPSPRPRLISHPDPASSPLPHVVFAHVQPPSKGESVSPSSSASSSLQDFQWTWSLLLAIILNL